jgi:hypothetical protein
LPYIIAAMVGGSLLFGTNVASAANIPPTGGLAPEVQQIWDATVGRIYGPFKTGPNYPGDGIRGSGTCSEFKLAILKKKQEQACGLPSKCNKGECDQSVIQQRINNRNACIQARLEVMYSCFDGGDGAHWKHINQQLDGQLHCERCKSSALANQCRAN